MFHRLFSIVWSVLPLREHIVVKVRLFIVDVSDRIQLIVCLGNARSAQNLGVRENTAVDADIVHLALEESIAVGGPVTYAQIHVSGNVERIGV